MDERHREGDSPGPSLISQVLTAHLRDTWPFTHLLLTLAYLVLTTPCRVRTSDFPNITELLSVKLV